MRGQRVVESADGEVDENFWAQQAAAANRSTPADGEEGEYALFCAINGD
jgi:hypothetical protein